MVVGSLSASFFIVKVVSASDRKRIRNFLDANDVISFAWWAGDNNRKVRQFAMKDRGSCGFNDKTRRFRN